MDSYAKKNIMAPVGPLIVIIFKFRLIHLNRLNWHNSYNSLLSTTLMNQLCGKKYAKNTRSAPQRIKKMTRLVTSDWSD